MHQHDGMPCDCKLKGVVGLVFVPGIMGSRLFNKEKQSVVWDPAVGMGSNPTGWLLTQREKRNRYMQLKLRNAISKASGADSANSADNIAKRAAAFLKLEPEQQFDDGEEIEELEQGKQNWRKLRGLWHLGALILSGADDRKQMLVNAEPGATERDDTLLEVDRGTDNYFETFTSVKPRDIEKRRQQGWGEVSWLSYGKFLRWLDRWVCSELKYKFNSWDFSTHVVGYNWMQSNQQSAKRLKDRVATIKQELIEEYSVSEELVKIIVISHSMGGYVARAAAILEDAEFDAVIHGAMPTHGSPAAYVNTRCGYSFPAGFALGANAAEVSAVVGFCQGALELLPNQHYKDQVGDSDWFKVQIEGQDPISITKDYPGIKIFDFYKDTSCWYSFIQPKLLMPSSDHGVVIDTVGFFKDRIDKVKQFHQNLSDNFHHTTQLLYGINTDLPSYDQCIWQAKKAPKGLPHNWQIFEDQNHEYSFGEGSLQLTDRQSMIDYVARYRQAWQQSLYSDGSQDILLDAVPPPPNIHFQLESAIAPGDGTVHMGAGMHPDGVFECEKFGLQLD